MCPIVVSALAPCQWRSPALMCTTSPTLISCCSCSVATMEEPPALRHGGSSEEPQQRRQRPGLDRVAGAGTNDAPKLMGPGSKYLTASAPHDKTPLTSPVIHCFRLHLNGKPYPRDSARLVGQCGVLTRRRSGEYGCQTLYTCVLRLRGASDWRKGQQA